MRYQKREWVGGGGYADVYKSLDTYTGNTVALKVLRVPSPENRRRFKRERDMLRVHWNNPYVIDIYDWDLDALTPYLVLEYSELGSLQQFVKSRKHWRVIAHLIANVSHALAQVHKRGQWHRDVKPGNILLFRDANGQLIAKLTDFGIARKPDTTSGPMTDTPFGTKEYLDPMARLSGKYTSPSDIYALGKTLRELLTGDRDRDNYSYDVPSEIRLLVSNMTSLMTGLRPAASSVEERLLQVLAKPELVLAPTIQPIDWKALLGTAGLGLLALAAVGNINTYDEKMGRYRDGQGRFRSSWWG